MHILAWSAGCLVIWPWDSVSNVREPLHPEERDKNGEKFSHHMITIPYEKNKFKTEKKKKEKEKRPMMKPLIHPECMKLWVTLEQKVLFNFKTNDMTTKIKAKRKCMCLGSLDVPVSGLTFKSPQFVPCRSSKSGYWLLQCVTHHVGDACLIY